MNVKCNLSGYIWDNVIRWLVRNVYLLVSVFLIICCIIITVFQSLFFFTIIV